jgi:hypothetical protein
MDTDFEFAEKRPMISKNIGRLANKIGDKKQYRIMHKPLVLKKID